MNKYKKMSLLIKIKDDSIPMHNIVLRIITKTDKVGLLQVDKNLFKNQIKDSKVLPINLQNVTVYYLTECWFIMQS